MPGGGLEPNEDSSAAAIREVMEEAGVIGHLARCLGSFEVRFVLLLGARFSYTVQANFFFSRKINVQTISCLSYCATKQHPERRHRTSVYVLNVTEELKEWEDSGSK